MPERRKDPFQEGMEAADAIFADLPKRRASSAAPSSVAQQRDEERRAQESPSWLDKLDMWAENRAQDLYRATDGAIGIDPSTYYGHDNYGPNAKPWVETPEARAPAPMTWLERTGNAAGEMLSEAGDGVNAVLMRKNRDYGDEQSIRSWAQLNGHTPEEADMMVEQAQERRANAVREERAMRDMRHAADPIVREGDSWYSPGSVGRFMAELIGGTLGDVNPTYALAPGGTALGRMGAQGGINAGTDVLTQGSEISEGIRDELDVQRILWNAAGGAGFQGAMEIPGAIASRRARLADEVAAADEGLVDAQLDGAPDLGAAAQSIDEILGSVGMRSDQFTSPEVAMAMAERISAARGRTNNVDPVTLRERSEISDAVASGEMDPSFMPPELRSRTLPDDVSLIGAPEGNVRSDEVGSMIGLMRQNAAESNVIDQARARAADNPTLQAILESSARQDQKVGALWERLAAMDAADRAAFSERLAPVDRSPADQPPAQRPTVEQARGENDGVFLPVNGKITSGVGQRKSFKTDNGGKASSNHTGIDIAASRGTPVAAPEGGTVIMAGEAGPNGNLVRIDHGNGVVSSYAHLDSINVKMGQRVGKGEVLGGVGSTGNSTGPHLHYGIRDNGKVVDPTTYRFKGQTPAEPTYRVGDQGADMFDQPQGPAERVGRRASPTDGEAEAGKVYRDTRDNTFYDEPGQSRELYEAPMATRGNRPFKDVDQGSDRPEARAPQDGPAPDGTPPRKGQSFFEDRQQQQMDDLMREYQASQSRRKERQSKRKANEKDPSQAYGEYGQKPAQSDAGTWRTTDDGMVADVDGKPVAFRNARAAAKWATANKMAGDFELVTWGANSKRVVLKKRSNSTYGTQGATENVTPNADAPEARSTDGTQAAIEAPRQRDNSRSDASSPKTTQGASSSSSPASFEPSRPPVTGKTQRVVTPAGREVDTQFEVRELRDVITSDDARFDKVRQPRDRGRDASDVQINDIAAKLDPEQLKGNRQAAHGSPIIGPDGMVEVGNGRTMGIRRAYENNPKSIESYKGMMRDEGYDIDGFDQPILVRRRQTEMSPDDMRAWVNEAQESGTMRYSAPEQAKADAGALSPDTMNLYRGGDVNAAANRDFIKAWSAETKADGNTLRASDGSLSLEGQQRVRASILSKAFDDETLVAKLLGDADNNIRAIGNVLLDSAGKFAQIKQLAADGRIGREFDISDKVAEMAGLISRSRSEGKKIGDLIGQTDMFGKNVDASTESLVRLMFKGDDLSKPRSMARLRDGFDFYLDGAAKTEDGAGMFGDELTPTDILEAARKSVEAKEAGAEQRSFYSYATGKKKPLTTRTTDLKSALARISKGSDEADYRELADRLSDVPDARIEVREGVEIDGVDGKVAAGVARPRSKRIELRNLADEETLLHEAVHMTLLRRYGDEFNGLKPDDLAAGPVAELVSLYNTARARYGNYGFWRKKSAGFDTKYALSSIDEFIPMALTNRKFQNWLQRGTIWDRLIDGFRKVLGLPKRMTPMLDDVVRAGSRAIEAAKADPVRADVSMSPAARLVDKDGLTRDAAKIREIIGDPKKALGQVGTKLKDVGSWTFFTSDARGRTIADRIESEAVHEYMDNFMSRPGMNDGKAVQRTYFEAVQKHANSRSQQAFRALDGILGNKASERRVADLLRYPNKRTKAKPEELKAAQELRALFKETLEYRKEAGEEIGEVADGYFPRWLDVDKVMANQDEFLTKAQRLYRSQGMDAKEAESAAYAWLNHTVDTYAGVDAGLDIRRASGDVVGSSTANARGFGKEADRLLADFYQDDLMQVTAQYFHGAARRAEQQRRFGKKGAVGSAERKAWEKEHGDKTQLDVIEARIREDAKKAGAKGRDVLGVLQKLHSVNLGRVGSMTNGERAAIGWAHTWTQLGVMDKAVLTSLAELAAGFVRGGPRQGLPFVRESLKQYVRQVKNAPPDDATRWAEALGVVQDALVNQALVARAGIEGASTKSQKMLANFYKATTLHQYTEGTRIAAVKMAQELVRQWSHDLGSSSGRISSRAKRYLTEVGVSDVDAFAAKVREGGFSMDDVKGETSALAREYATAVIRVGNQTIMRPTRAEKPTWASHPVGSMIFSLMSYSFGFKKQVLDRAGRMAVQGVKERDITLLSPALGLAILTAWQGVNDSYLRPTLFGGGPPDDETAIETGLRVADRAGLTGGASPIINALTGARYRRGVIESLLGPVIGRPGELIDKSLGLLINNTENTNTAERKAAGALYDNVVEPGMDALAAVRLLGVARTTAVMGTGNREGGIAPSDREMFVEALAGKAKK